MAALQDLPVELLLMVMDRLQPDDFESFALTCKTTHDVCAPYIRKHNALKARYGELCQPSMVLSASSWSFGRVLLNIWRMNSNVSLYNARLYIKKITFDPFAVLEVYELYNLSNRSSVRPFRVPVSVFREVTSRYPGLYAGYREAIRALPPKDYIRGGDHMALLLPTLSNVRGIVIIRPDDLYDYFAPVMSIIEAEIVLNVPSAPLQYLTKVTLKYARTLLVFEPFLGLPHLQELCSEDMAWCVPPEPGTFTQWVKRTSNVQSISFPMAFVATKNLPILFLPFTQLKSLHIGNDKTPNHGNSLFGSPKVLARELGKQCSTTLKQLSLKIWAHTGLSPIGGFRRFHRLETLTISLNLLMTVFERRSANVPRLADILPTSIQKFHLDASQIAWFSDANKLFIHLRVSETELPELKCIEVCSKNLKTAPKTVRKNFERTNVQLIWTVSVETQREQDNGASKALETDSESEDGDGASEALETDSESEDGNEDVGKSDDEFIDGFDHSGDAS